MNYVYWFIGIVFIVSFISGIYKFNSLEVGIELNSCNSPYCHIGISFDRQELMNEDGLDTGLYLEELILGMFFINIIFKFYKKKEA